MNSIGRPRQSQSTLCSSFFWTFQSVDFNFSSIFLSQSLQSPLQSKRISKTNLTFFLSGFTVLTSAWPAVENENVKVDPFPRCDLNKISPLSPFAIYWQMLRPSPCSLHSKTCCHYLLLWKMQKKSTFDLRHWYRFQCLQHLVRLLSFQIEWKCTCHQWQSSHFRVKTWLRSRLSSTKFGSFASDPFAG